jgi:hypothetical protein
MACMSVPVQAHGAGEAGQPKADPEQCQLTCEIPASATRAGVSDPITIGHLVRLTGPYPDRPSPASQASAV